MSEAGDCWVLYTSWLNTRRLSVISGTAVACSNGVCSGSCTWWRRLGGTHTGKTLSFARSHQNKQHNLTSHTSQHIPQTTKMSDTSTQDYYTTPTPPLRQDRSASAVKADLDAARTHVRYPHTFLGLGWGESSPGWPFGTIPRRLLCSNMMIIP